MTLILLLIIVAVVVVLALRPKASPEPIVIYIDRTPYEERAGGCLPTLMALVAIGVLIILLAT